MEAGRALFTVPHSCDESFMHMQAPTTHDRFKVCSGTQGQQATPPAMVYSLSAKGGSIDSGDPPPPLARWMRTYSESTGGVHVGVLSHATNEDVPLGFLGANAGLDGPMGDMAFGNGRFFRCADRMACQNPPFTYNGLDVDRIDPALGKGNFSEASLRRCGSIGFLAKEWNTGNDEDAGVCWLDISMFPVFAQAIWGNPGTGGCAALWPKVGGLAISVDSLTPDGQNAASIHSSPLSFFCDTIKNAAGAGKCVYAARASTRLVETSDQDSIAVLTETLNALLRSSGNAVRLLFTNEGSTRAYEHINRCAAQLMLTVTISQQALQSAHNSAAPSGLYYALRVTLYEFPIAWLHHAMLVALLSLVDPAVPFPQFASMGSASVSVFLWSDEVRVEAPTRSCPPPPIFFDC
jgi:hypothetical protein